MHMLGGYRFLDEKDNGGNGGAGAGSEGAKTPKSKEELEDQLDRMAQRRGGMKAVALELLEERIEDRQALRTAKERLGKANAPGARILDANEAKEFDAYKALGLTPDKAKEQLDRTTALEKENAEAKRIQQARQVAALDGYKYQPDAFAKLVVSDDLHLEVVDVTEKVNGTDVTRKVAKARPAGDEKAALVELSAFLKDHPFLPALKVTASGNGTSGSGAGSTSGAAGVPFPLQTGTGDRPSETKGGIDDAIRANHERARAPNALRPAAPAAK